MSFYPAAILTLVSVGAVAPATCLQEPDRAPSTHSLDIEPAPLTYMGPVGEIYYQPAAGDELPASVLSDEELMGVRGGESTQPALPHGVASDPYGDLLYFTHGDSIDGGSKTVGTEQWVRGRTYKAWAGPEGFSYIPFLGSTASRNYPVTFRVLSATVGAEPLALLEAGVVSRSGDRLTVDRGSIQVHYDLSMRSVEQSFAIQAAGAGGDLVLVVDVESDLTAADRFRVLEGLRFDGPEGGVDYGAATVLDGMGRSAPVPIRFEGGAITLTVPREFLARAEGEVLVDPLITTFGVDETSGDQGFVDVAYDLDTDSFMYVYEDTFSNPDRNIYSRRYTSQGAFLGGAVVFGNNEIWRHPSIANLNGEDVNLIVAARTNSIGLSEVYGRIYDVAGNLFGPVFALDSIPFAYFDSQPDVGGNSTSAAGGVFFVAWMRKLGTSSPRLRFCTVDANGTVAGLDMVTTGPGYTMDEPAISKSTGNPSTVNQWNLVHRLEVAPTDRDVIVAHEFNASGVLVDFNNTIQVSEVGERLRQIDVSDALDLLGEDPTYVACFDSSTAPVEDVGLIGVRNGQAFRTLDLSIREHTNQILNQDYVRLGTTESDFIVTYLEDQPGEALVYTTALDLIDPTHFGISERRTLIGSAGAQTGRGGAAIASRFSGGFIGSLISGVGWSKYDASGGDFEALGATLYNSGLHATAYQYCTSGRNATGDYGFLTMYGTRSLNTPKFAQASSLPPGQFSILLVGDVVNNVPMIGGTPGTLCLGGTFGRYNAQIAQVDAAGIVGFVIEPGAIPGPQGPYGAIAGQDYFWQAWHRDTAAGTPTANLTNAVSMSFE